MIYHLKEMFQEKSRIERFNTIRALLSCKLTASGSVSPHILKIKGHLEHLDKLDLKIEQEFAIDIILQYLLESYDGFIINFNMHSCRRRGLARAQVYCDRDTV